jgi:hypothetical protein
MGFWRGPRTELIPTPRRLSAARLTTTPRPLSPSSFSRLTARMRRTLLLEYGLTNAEADNMAMEL